MPIPIHSNSGGGIKKGHAAERDDSLEALQWFSQYNGEFMPNAFHKELLKKLGKREAIPPKQFIFMTPRTTGKSLFQEEWLKYMQDKKKEEDNRKGKITNFIFDDIIPEQDTSKKKQLLIIEPHFDDILISSFGTLLKYQKKGWVVNIVTLCKGRDTEQVDRMQYLMDIYLEYGFNFEFLFKDEDIYDLEINDTFVSDIASLLKEKISILKPSKIFIPPFDLHSDHRYVNMAAKIACRPTFDNRFIKEILEYKIPSSYVWDTLNIQQNNTGLKVINLNKKFEKIKRNIIRIFNDITLEFPDKKIDMRNPKIFQKYQEVEANIFGNEFSEIFKIVYSRG